MKRLLLLTCVLTAFLQADAQNFNVGVTFQYYILKQVSVDASTIFPRGSYNYYRVFDNNWKFFSGGQSIVIGLVAQLDYKRFYGTFEPSFELNTYDYRVSYPLTNNSDDIVSFRTTYMQYDFPLYAGYQFSTSNVLRFSLFAGAEVVIPLTVNASFGESAHGLNPYDRYGLYDMRDVIYNLNPVYFNGLAGVAVHFASLFRVELRYKQRLDTPGEVYRASFHSVGLGLTYYLPLRLLKQKVYYEN